MDNGERKTYKVFYDWTKFPFEKLSELKVISKRGQRKAAADHNRRYANIICSFDIETTVIEEIKQSVCYIWQFSVDNQAVVFGRTIQEFIDFLTEFYKNMPQGLTIPIFVHNLSYEFQFLRGVYNFKEWQVFCMDSRKILRCFMFGKAFEFRCSYYLTNMSLNEAAEKYNSDYKKLSGIEFDYDKKRYPWTKLSKQEYKYCMNDVLSVVNIVYNIMEMDGKDIYNLPFTSTGFVRDDVRAAMNFELTNVRQQFPDFDCYKLMKKAFRGGNTHANRFYCGKVVENVKSYDRVSSYPDVLLNRKFPMKPFCKTSVNNFETYLARGKALLLYIKLYNVELKDRLCPCPYLSYSKCYNMPKHSYTLDNGRVLQASYLETALTDIDYKILSSMYKWSDAEIVELYYSSYAYLPKAFRGVVMDYFKKKTELKNVEGQETFYMKSKNKLNAIYGMCVTDIIKPCIQFYDNDYHKKDETNEQELERYNRQQNKSFVVYAWGVWVTAWARYCLQLMINLVGDDFIYCDTDSVKFIGEHDISKINKELYKLSYNNGSYAFDKHGQQQTLGIYEQEKTAEYFRTWGAKKYAGIYDGKLKITVAGVPKKLGVDELLEKSGMNTKADIYNPEKSAFDKIRYNHDIQKFSKIALTDYFTLNTIFYKAGGLCPKFNDENFGKYEINGHKLIITANTALLPSTYTLGLSQDYKNLLSSTILDWDKIFSM